MISGTTGAPEQKGLNLTAVSWSAVRITVIVCFLPRPADVRDAPDVRSAQPVSVSYCEEPSPAVGCVGDGASTAQISRCGRRPGRWVEGWFSAARRTMSREKAGAA